MYQIYLFLAESIITNYTKCFNLFNNVNSVVYVFYVIHDKYLMKNIL